MSDSTTKLDLISASQASKEVTANALFDAESPAALYGRRASTTANLTWGYYGGALSVNGVVTAIPNGTKTLTNGATNYLEADPTTGNVAVNTSNFTAANIPLYAVVTAGNLVVSYTDYRVGPGFFADKGGSGSQAFMVGVGSQANHAARIDQISLMPSVASNASVDIFGAAGATIDLTGNVTVTGIAACTAAQVGSTKRIIPSDAAGVSFTASANIIIDGATSGTYLMPHDAIIEVLAKSTTLFVFTTILATGTSTFTLTAATTPPTTPITTVGNWIKQGPEVFLNVAFSNRDTTGAVGTLQVTGSPFAAGTLGLGSCNKSGLGASSDVSVINSGSSTITFEEISTTTPTAIVAGANKYLRVSIRYQVN